MRVSVVPYQSSWPSAFQRIKDSLEVILSSVPVVNIEHVGSTAIPGLAAKPIIDVDVIVAPEYLDDAAAALSSNGYTYNPEPTGIDRMSFRYNAHKHDSGGLLPTEDGDARRAVYLNVPTGLALKNHLALRKVLLRDPELAREYAEIKLGLGNQEFDHIGSYGRAKGQIIRKILAQSDMQEVDLMEIAEVNSGRRRTQLQSMAMASEAKE